MPKIQERVTNKDKVIYWPQYSTVQKTDEVVELFDKDNFNIVFTGNIGEAQGIDIAIEAANILKNEKICWHFIGEGRNREKLMDMVSKYGISDKVKFYGFHPETEIPKYLSNADAALLILKPNPVFEMTIPAKLQTYLACGVPILGCVSGEGKRIIEESGAGIVSDSVSVNDLVKVCQTFNKLDDNELDSYKIQAYNYGEKNFSKLNLIKKLEILMEDLR